MCEIKYEDLTIVSTGPFGEIPEDEFDKILEMVGDS